MQDLRTDFTGSWYYGITTGIIFQANASAGYIMGWGGDDVRINDRYFKGGQTFRGFENAGIGPRDTQFQEALGGKAFRHRLVRDQLPEPAAGPVRYQDGPVHRVRYAGPSRQVAEAFAYRARQLGSAGFCRHQRVLERARWPRSASISSKILRKEAYDRTEGFRFSTSTQF